VCPPLPSKEKRRADLFGGPAIRQRTLADP